MNNSFWDRDSNGKFDIVDVFWLLLQIVAYGVGAFLMLSTYARSYHLLSSPEMSPGFWWWPFLTAASAEAGLIMAWLALEVGMRKGQIIMVSIAALGFLTFGLVVGTMQLYDVALIEGQDISTAQAWGHWIASVLPLITIGYSSIMSAALSYMARREKLRGGWTVSRPKQEIVPHRELGGPIDDPLARPTLPQRRGKSDNGNGLEELKRIARSVDHDRTY